MKQQEIESLRFTLDTVQWIKDKAGTLSDYELNQIKTMLQFDKEKITLKRLKSVYFTATHEDEIEQVVYQQLLVSS